MKKLLLLLTAACCIASCAEIRTTYIGKAYPTTGTAPELYFDWKDVPSDYETMGSIKATPFGKTLEEAQALIEQIGREKGADAIVATRQARSRDKNGASDGLRSIVFKACDVSDERKLQVSYWAVSLLGND